MGAVTTTIKELGEIISAWWPLLAVIGAVIAAACRYGLRCYRRAQKFWGRLEVALIQVEKLDRAFTVNGGSSAIDMIRKTNHHARMTSARLGALEDHIERPLFEADRTGAFSRVNKAFEQISGFSNADLVLRGWINLVHPEDRRRVMDEWFHAIADRRACAITMRILTRHHRVMSVNLAANPVIDDETEELFSWHGQMALIGAEKATT